MTVLKDQRFAATADWAGGKRVLVGARDKVTIHVATPPELGGTDHDLWSPEELLLAACASCYELTVAGVAARRGVPIHSIEVRSAGHVTRRDDGRLGFIVIELDVVLGTEPEFVAAAEATARLAKDVCIVTTALDVPVHLTVSAHAEEAEVAVR